MTIVPNFLLTGIIAICVSLIVILWVVFFIRTKYGSLIFLLLSFIQFLVGGGIVIDLAIMASILATRINKPLKWWRRHLSKNVQRILANLWPWSIIAYSLLSFILLLITILGVNNPEMIKLVLISATIMFFPILLSIVGGFAYDIQRQTNTD